MVGEGAVYSSLDAESTELSWKVISSIYGVGVVICAGLAIIELAGWHADTFRNAWLMFVPFVPCCVYGLARLYLQKSQPPPAALESKKER